jgi:hypothetical protein
MLWVDCAALKDKSFFLAAAEEDVGTISGISWEGIGVV